MVEHIVVNIWSSSSGQINVYSDNPDTNGKLVKLESSDLLNLLTLIRKILRER